MVILSVPVSISMVITILAALPVFFEGLAGRGTLEYLMGRSRRCSMDRLVFVLQRACH